MHYDQLSYSMKIAIDGTTYSVNTETLQAWPLPPDVIFNRYFIRDAFVTFWSEVDCFTFHCFQDRAREGDQYAMVAP